MLGIQDTPGASIRRSDVMLLAGLKQTDAVNVIDVLTAAGMLDDDHQPAICRWFPQQIADLPEPMQTELAEWFEVMRTGSTVPPRIRPRAETTITSQFRWALPALRHWAETHPSLREISKDDVQAILPPAGMPRSCMLQGLRSIFKVLNGRRLVFVNPTARISIPAPQKTVPAPVDLAIVRAALDAEKPARAALTALLFFHAIRIKELRLVRLADVRDGRLHLADRTVLLADPARQRLAAYQQFRQHTWPYAINPYLFTHPRNAINTKPVSVWWIRHQLPIPGQQIRLDRILHEADATGGDVGVPLTIVSSAANPDDQENA